MISSKTLTFAQEYLLKLGPDLVSRLGYSYQELAARIGILSKSKTIFYALTWKWPTEVHKYVQKLGRSVQMGNFEAANEALCNAIELTPDDPWLRVSRINVLIQLGDIEAAYWELIKITNMYPQYSSTHVLLGAVTISLGLFDEAGEAFRKALALNPDDVNLQEVLAGLEANDLVDKPSSSVSEPDVAFEACFALLREPKQRGMVKPGNGAGEKIIASLEQMGLEVKDFVIDVPDFHAYFSNSRYLKDFVEYYPRQIAEKSLEHYIAAKLLNLSEYDIYIEIASESSPIPEIYSRQFGTKTYRQNLSYPSGIEGDRIGGDATDLPVPAGFATAIGLHCSFEHFEGDSDIGFIKEAARVLRPGGKVCIVPFYLVEEYAIQTDPVVAILEGVEFEHEAKIYCVQDWRIRYGRYYDPLHFYNRVVKNLNGLDIEIYRIANPHQVDPTCYVQYAALLRKPVPSVIIEREAG